MIDFLYFAGLIFFCLIGFVFTTAIAFAIVVAMFVIIPEVIKEEWQARKRKKDK